MDKQEPVDEEDYSYPGTAELFLKGGKSILMRIDEYWAFSEIFMRDNPDLIEPRHIPGKRRLRRIQSS